MKALEVARYFLFLARRVDAGDTFSNLKIQKMLYYAQGYSLALRHKPLFDERIEAWENGPVVREVYREFKHYSNNSISFDELDSFNTDSFKDDKEILDILILIFNKYGSMGAWKLRNKTHSEDPYLKSYSPNLNNEIPQNLIEEFFQKELDREALKLEIKRTFDEDLKKYGFIK